MTGLTPEERVARNCVESYLIDARQFVEWMSRQPLGNAAAALEAVVAHKVRVETERCLRRVHEQRCERGTPWDRALTAAVNAIRNDEPVVALGRTPSENGESE
jgi:hypothetical protein